MTRIRENARAKHRKHCPTTQSLPIGFGKGQAFGVMTPVRVETAQILQIGFGKGQAFGVMPPVRVETAQIQSIGSEKGQAFGMMTTVPVAMALIQSIGFGKVQAIEVIMMRAKSAELAGVLTKPNRDRVANLTRSIVGVVKIQTVGKMKVESHRKRRKQALVIRLLSDRQQNTNRTMEMQIARWRRNSHDGDDGAGPSLQLSFSKQALPLRRTDDFCCHFGRRSRQSHCCAVRIVSSRLSDVSILEKMSSSAARLDDACTNSMWQDRQHARDSARSHACQVALTAAATLHAARVRHSEGMAR